MQRIESIKYKEDESNKINKDTEYMYRFSK